MYDSELKIDAPYFVMSSFSGTKWERYPINASRETRDIADTQRPYIGQKEFCGADCFQAFLMTIVDEVRIQEQPLKMEQLKQ